jgi:hypothetical protein
LRIKNAVANCAKVQMILFLNKILKLLVGIFILISPFLSPAQENSDFPRREDKCLRINGRVLEDGSFSKDYKVRLYSKNKCIEDLDVKQTSFSFLLKKNDYYTLEVYKEGYYPKRIVFATDIADKKASSRFHRFDFDINLIRKESNVFDFYLDFPAAIVSYETKTDAFIVNEEYFKNMHVTLQNSFNSNKKNVKLNGKVLDEGIQVGYYDVKLMQDNKCVDSLTIKDKRIDFNFLLYPNKNYTVEIHKDGFHLKKLAVSTMFFDEAIMKKSYLFNFDINLTPIDHDINDDIERIISQIN